jgi:YoeB-like toxin of bacterial type II toxin-antitoxin system
VRSSDPFARIGKPEHLEGDLSGYWSRRIDDEHRLVYRADDKEVKILKARIGQPRPAEPDSRRSPSPSRPTVATTTKMTTDMRQIISYDGFVWIRLK